MRCISGEQGNNECLVEHYSDPDEDALLAELEATSEHEYIDISDDEEEGHRITQFEIPQNSSEVSLDLSIDDPRSWNPGKWLLFYHRWQCPRWGCSPGWTRSNFWAWIHWHLRRWRRRSPNHPVWDSTKQLRSIAGPIHRRSTFLSWNPGKWLLFYHLRRWRRWSTNQPNWKC